MRYIIYFIVDIYNLYLPRLSDAGSVVPEQRLPIVGETFEEQVCSAILDVFEPFGFDVLCWTKLPYLCEGDLSQDYYWLHDAVFILSVRQSSKTE